MSTLPPSPVPLPLVFEALPLAGPAAPPVSLDVPERHTVVVLGDEDSGIGLLGGYALGLERPTSGRALVFGTDIAALPGPERLAFRRRVGYLPSGDGLLQNLSLRDNVALPLRFGSGASPRDIEGRVNVMLTALRIAAPYQDLALGESISVDGACLTVERFGPGWFTVHVVATSLERTAFGAYAAGRKVNLERALAVGERLGGHLVSGHVDGVGRVTASRAAADAWLLDLTLPPAVAPQ